MALFLRKVLPNPFSKELGWIVIRQVFRATNDRQDVNILGEDGGGCLVYQGGTKTYLRLAVPQNIYASECPTAINDNGQIAGPALINGETDLVELNAVESAVPEPRFLPLLGVAVIAGQLFRRGSVRELLSSLSKQRS